MRRCICVVLVVFVTSFLIACGGGSDKVSSNNFVPGASQPKAEASAKLTCPKGFTGTGETPEEVALSAACRVALGGKLSMDFTKVVVLEQDNDKRTARVSVFANKFGCSNCPEEVVATFSLLFNVTDKWEISSKSISFELTEAAKAAQIEKEKENNQKAVVDSKVTGIGKPVWLADFSYKINIEGDFSPEVWLELRLQFSDGQTFDFRPVNFNHYGREKPASGQYLFNIFGVKAVHLGENSKNPKVIAYRFLTYKSGNQYNAVDTDSGWQPWGGK